MFDLRPLRALALVLAAAVPTADGTAQIPDGHVVVSSVASWPLGAGGLSIVPPRGGVVTPVTGLGVDLTGSTSQYNMGSNCVAISPVDGALLVGEFGPSGTQIDLHVIHLNGSAVATDRRIRVGTTDTFGGINQIVALPNGDAVVVLSGLSNGAPRGGFSLATITRAGQVVPLTAVGAPPTDHHALAIAPDQATLYFDSLTPVGTAYAVWSVPAAGGNARMLATLDAFTPSLAVDSRGRVLAAQRDTIVEIDPRTGAKRQRARVPLAPNGIAVEPATDDVFVVVEGRGSGPGLYRVDNAGIVHPVTTSIPGAGTGVAAAPDPVAYGSSSPGPSDYTWRVAPAPGGLPRAGNSAFGLLLNAGGGSAAGGFVLANVRPADLSALGLRILIDPIGAVSIAVVPASGLVPLPIPGNVPVGMSIYVQSFHSDPRGAFGVASSNGQRITFLR